MSFPARSVRPLPAAALLLAAAACSAEGGPADGAAGQDPDPAASRLVFEKRVVRLGEVRQTETREAVFPFRVEGPHDVQLESMEHSCGCTNVYIRPDWLGPSPEDGALPKWPIDRPIPAGAEGAVVAVFRTDTKLGRMPVSITLRGDMQNSPVVLELIAEVRAFWKMEPGMVKFGDVLAAPLRQEDPALDVRITGPGPFTVERWSRIPHGVAVEEVGEPEAGADGEQTRTFRFRITEDVRSKVIDGYADAETSLGAPLRLVVSAQVSGPVRYRPPHRLVFGVWDEGQRRQRVILVEPTQEEVELPRPEIVIGGEAGSRVEHELSALPEGGWKVQLAVPADAPPGPCSGNLEVRWPADAGLESHQIMLTGLLREAT